MSRFNEKYIENQLVKACNIALKKYTVNYNHAEEVATIGIFSTGTNANGSPSTKKLRVSITYQLIAEITVEALANLIRQSYAEALDHYLESLKAKAV